MPPDQLLPMNRCGLCSATSYRPLIERDEAGAMSYTDRLVCSGCGREFSDLHTWRRGANDAPPPATPAQ